jgi:hypothetical protein
MNKTPLTQIHLERLSQMCDDLFPEYDFMEFQEEFCVFFNNNGIDKMHWFELCVIELPQRIAESLNTVYPRERQAQIVDLMMKKMLNFSSIDKKHPVDYLYEMYEKTINNEANS